jgi:hypothetical protein
MIVERTRKDIFLDYILQAPDELESTKGREDLEALGFWSEQQDYVAVKRSRDAEFRRFMRQMPRYDEEGNLIERVNVERKTADGVKHLYVKLTAAGYEDVRFVCQGLARRIKYFSSELARMLDFASGNLPAKDARKLRREFQGLLFVKEPEPVS